MDLKSIYIGPILGSQTEKVLYCLDSDESSMIEPEEKLTEEQQKKDLDYVRNNSSFTLSVLSLTKPGDIFILDRNYKESEEILRWFQSIFRKLGLNITENVFFEEPKQFARLAQKIVNENNIEVISTICYSHHLSKFFNISDLLDISIRVNSKTYLPTLAERFDFNILETATTSVKDIDATLLKRFNFPNSPVYFKFNGLGGGNNVFKVTSESQLDSLLSSYSSETELILQKPADPEYLEISSSCISYDDHVEYCSSRIMLVLESTWYGNIYPKEFLNDSQKDTFIKAGKATQSEGYKNKHGLRVGFNGFIGDGQTYVIEYNARWGGSTPSELLLKKLGILGNTASLAAYDYIELSEFNHYQEFVEDNLYIPTNKKSFSIIPMSYSAYIDGTQRLVNYLVIGDFEEFYNSIKQQFSRKSFSMIDNTYKIYLETKDKLRNIK